MLRKQFPEKTISIIKNVLWGINECKFVKNTDTHQAINHC